MFEIRIKKGAEYFFNRCNSFGDLLIMNGFVVVDINMLPATLWRHS